jgi:hypothetical protein
MMLVASFEAMMRSDAKERIRLRTKDMVRKPLDDLFKCFEGRVRLNDILAIWEKHTGMASAIKQDVQALLKHRHWLAHGREWTNKHGAVPLPHDARASQEDYIQAIQAMVGDFPRT